MKGEKTLTSKVIYEGRAVKLRVDDIELPSGRKSTREVIEHADCVAIVAIDSDDNVLLVRQYRTPVEKELLEIPAGGIDPGENAEEAVRRELQEETGYVPGNVVCLNGFYSAPGYATEYLYLYLATDLKPSKLFAEDTESIEVVKVPVKDLRKLLASGKICDSKSIAGLFTYLDYREKH